VEFSSFTLPDRGLLDHILRLPHARANFKHLARELRVKGEARDQLQAALDRLETSGELVAYRNGHYAATSKSREFTSGRLNIHRDGFGFVIPDRPIEGMQGDVFINPKEAAKAMHGDRVMVHISRFGGEGRAEGEILKILKRAHQTVVGQFMVRKRGNYVKPHDERIRQWIFIPDGMEKPPATTTVDRIGVKAKEIQDLDGMIVNVELLEYPEYDDDAVGRVIEVLGAPDDFGVDVEIIIRKFHIPHEFSPEVLQQAAQIPAEIPPEEIQGRKDFRDLDIVTIDGETARDFDDAVWVENLPNGNFTLQVHIADVGHYVRPGSPIDTEAFLRGTSVYFPDRAVPMLPVELSTGICSLNPHVDRLVLSVCMELDHRGDVVASTFHRGVIRSVERMTYTSVHKLLDGDAAERERYSKLVPRFELMREMALILNRKRTRRGSIDFDLPEPLIEFDEEGLMTGVARYPRNIAHRIIEEFMLAANETVATHIESAAVPSIYRIHEPPDPKRVMDFEQIAATFGYSLGVGAIPIKRFPIVDRRRDGRKVRKDIELPSEQLAVTSRMYQKLIAKLEGKPEERIVSQLMLRSLKQARYSAENSGHFALAAESYTHFTSPIRRYPDLIVHRVLAAMLDGSPTKLEESDLSAIAGNSSDTERRAAEAERELLEWKKVKFMMDRVGEEFPALIISTTKFGFFVELVDLFIEGLVPIDTLPGDHYRYSENTRKITAERSRREFAIGDKVTVLLDRVDGVEKKLQFSIYEPQKKRKR
jgi:ribonuclease R